MIALHLAMNAAVGNLSGSVRAANAVFWVIGASVACLVWLLFPNREAIGQVWRAPPWLLCAGAMGALLVFGIAWLIPRQGAGPTMVLLLAGQVVAGAVISHLGALGSPESPITLSRVAGAALMLAGVCLAVR